MESGMLLLVQLALRIVGTAVCINKAGKLNRDKGGWGIFGFFMPIIAMIWIQFMKPVIVWDKDISGDTKKE